MSDGAKDEVAGFRRVSGAGFSVEGRVYDPSLDSSRMAVVTDDGEYVYVENELEEGTRVRVTIEVLDV